jgi:5-hydroxyisourate hydrolase
MDQHGAHISTHVLDTQLGAPAAGVRVRLFHVVADGAAVDAGEGVTDADGRVRQLSRGPLVEGIYRLTFDLHDHASGGFFRAVSLEIHVQDVSRSYHVPLLVSPFSVTSYRGS